MKNTDTVKDSTHLTGTLTFASFPAFAGFIKENHLIPYIQEQLRVSREVHLPLLRYLEGIPEEQLIAMSLGDNTTFLEFARQNRLQEHITNSITRWLTDASGIIKKEEVTAEDVTLAAYLRKKALMKFLPYYTNDIAEAIAIMEEIDRYTTENLAQTTNTYIGLLRERIHEETHFSESISYITPGLNYVFDLKKKQITFANKNYQEHFGYNLEQLQGLGPEIISLFMHPGDIEHHKSYLKQSRTLQNKEIISWVYRVKDHTGIYKWMRNYASAFRRDDNGIVSEIIGIIVDIDKETKTGEKLLESERNLLRAQQLSHIGNWYWKLSANECTWSEELYRIYEMEPRQGFVDPELSRAYRHPDDMKMVDEQMQRLRESYTPCEYNCRIVLPSGKIKHLNVKGEALFDRNNEAVALLGSVQDITEKQTLIDQLQHRDELYKQAQAISHIGNWTWDAETKKMEWSEELYHIYELEPGSLAESTPALAFNHPDDNELVAEAMRAAVEINKPFDFHYRIILANDKIKILHAKGEPEKNTSGTTTKIYGTLQDVTEQKQAEKQVKEYKDFIERITDVTPSIITSYNIHTGKYSFINNSLEKSLGYPVSLAMEQGVPFFTSILHPDDLPLIMAQNTKALNEANSLGFTDTEPVTEFKYRMRHKNGEYLWFHTFGTVFERNKNGTVDSVLNVSVEITEQELTQRALQLKNLQLQQSNTSLEEYAYVASHDLKEPLRKIATYADRMISTQQESLTEDGKQFLTKIIDSSRRMQKLTSDLLSVSTILGNKAYESSDLNELLADALQQLEQKIEDSSAIIDADKLPVANVVPSQFRQLFQNLVGNSLKFSNKETSPHITIKHEFLDQGASGIYHIVKAKKYLKIEFTDNGIGFDDQYADKIFAIFQRLHGNVAYEGTGIGLAVCKKIAENHNGIIFAKGIPGISAIFTIIIPQ